MYYKSVNRGLSLTTPGVYALVLVFVSGLIAINTGVNALFLFLASGLSLILVSGILSESAIKHYEITGFLQRSTETGKPFELLIITKNKHRYAPIYGIENYAVHEPPSPLTIILPNKPKGSFGSGNVLSLPGMASKTISIQMDAMDRGLYRSITFLLRTNFPFGLIDKFKMTEVKGYLTVLPKIIPDLYEQLKKDYRKRVATQDTEREFFSHRPHSTTDSLRQIDWKKSAGKPARLWVQKEYRSEVAEFGILLSTNWNAMRRSSGAETYELMISTLRTAAEVIKNASRELVLLHDDGTYTVGYHPVCQHLAGIPSFTSRDLAWEKEESKSEIKGVFLELQMSVNGYEWGTYTSHDTRLKAGRVL